MTPDEMSRLTLGEIEQIAGRTADAVHLLRDALRLVGPVPVAASATVAAPSPPPPAAPTVVLTPAERAKRDALLSQFGRGQVPDAMAAAMEGDK